MSRSVYVAPQTRFEWDHAQKATFLEGRMHNVAPQDRLSSLKDLYASINRCGDVDAGRLACKVARNIPEADTDFLQSVVVKRGTADHAVEFAHRVPGADTKLLEQKVLHKGDAPAAYWFARHVAGADLMALQARVFHFEDAQTGTFFARDIPGSDIAGLQRLVLTKGTARDVGIFAADVKGADTRLLQTRFESLINKDCLDLCTDFAVNVAESEVRTLLKRLTQLGDTGHLIDFAARLSHSQRQDEPGVIEVIEHVQSHILARRNPGELFDFARRVKCADVGVLFAAAQRVNLRGLPPAKTRLFAALAKASQMGVDQERQHILSPEPDWALVEDEEFAPTPPTP